MLVKYLKDNSTDIEKTSGIGALRESIMELFFSIESSLYESKRCNKKDLNRAANMTEKYVNLCNLSNDCYLKDEAEALERTFNMLAAASVYFNANSGKAEKINEWLNRGFDTFDDSDVTDNSAIDIKEPVKPVNVYPHISNAKNKVMFKNGRMYAGISFTKGDVIEEAPVRVIYAGDLYSRSIRDLTFEIDAEQGLYALPFGYASYYTVSENDANASYIFVSGSEGTGNVVIRALTSIRKGEEIRVKKDQANTIAPRYNKFEMDRNRMGNITVSSRF